MGASILHSVESMHWQKLPRNCKPQPHNTSPLFPSNFQLAQFSEFPPHGLSPHSINNPVIINPLLQLSKVPTLMMCIKIRPCPSRRIRVLSNQKGQCITRTHQSDYQGFEAMIYVHATLEWVVGESEGDVVVFSGLEPGVSFYEILGRWVSGVVWGNGGILWRGGEGRHTKQWS